MRNLVGLWVNLFRGIEVAKTGGYSISIHFDENYENGFDDYQQIKSFCNGFFDNFVSDGDIKIQISKPTSYQKKGNFETLVDIENRIKKSLLFQKPSLNLSSSSIAILDRATEKLNLSLSKVEKIKEVSATIAQMSFSEIIQAEHIAESIIYSYVSKESCYNAEENSKMFGNKIKIALGEIDKESIQSAINYLNSLI